MRKPPTHKRVCITFVPDTEEFRVFPLGLSAKREEDIAGYETDHESAMGTARAMAGDDGVIVDKTPRKLRTAS